MASTKMGDLTSRVFQELTEDLSDVYEQKAKVLAFKMLDSKDIDRTFPRFLDALMKMGAVNAKEYDAFSRNFLEIFAVVEGIDSKGLKASIREKPFIQQEQIMKRRMVGAGVLGYRRALSKAGVSMASLPDKNPLFRQAVKNLSMDFAQNTFAPGRNTITELSINHPDFGGFSRNTDSGACDFCLMLATRKNYKTGKFEAHRKCACSPEPVTRDWLPPEDRWDAYDRFRDKQAELNEGFKNTEERLAIKRQAKEVRNKPDGENISYSEAIEEIKKKRKR